MYKEFFGLTEAPFQISPDPRFLYMSEQHHAAYAHLTYAISESKGFTVITGEAGTGKTTLIQRMLSRLDGHTRTAHLNNPKLTVTDFLKYICQDLGLNTEGLATKGDLLTLLHRFLMECYAREERVVLIIDEAQALPPRLLEEVRLLTNLETPTSKLLQVIMMGQPELEKVLSDPRFRQLTQRISVRYHLDPLNLDQTRKYIEHRLKVAGSKGEHIFEPEATRLIWKFSKGIPRVINTLCDGAMVIANSSSRKVVDGQIAKQTIRDMGYLKPKAEKRNFRLPAFLYAAAGTLLAVVVVIGAQSVWDRSRAVPPPEKGIAPENAPIVKRSVALSSMARQHYGVVNPTVLDILLQHNPHVTDMNRIPVDRSIEVPQITDDQLLGIDEDGKPFLYLGTYEDEQAIQALRNNALLKGKTFKTTLREVSSNTHWYRLTVGGFKTTADARKTLESLKRQGLLPAFSASP